jgi:hypothetical protein
MKYSPDKNVLLPARGNFIDAMCVLRQAARDQVDVEKRERSVLLQRVLRRFGSL